jgi:hypothetical protein
MQVKNRGAALPKRGVFREIRFAEYSSKPFLYGNSVKIWLLGTAPIPI